MSQIPKVALLIKLPDYRGLRFLAGINRYIGSEGRWSLVPEISFAGPEWLTLTQWDGILFSPFNSSSYKEMNRLIRGMKVPVVFLHGSLQGAELPWVDVDNGAIGRMGALHFMERGFQHFAFCGFSDCHWSGLRCDSFQAAVAEKGFSASTHQSTLNKQGASDWNYRISQIAEWIKPLPKPLAIMACNDQRGINVIDACKRLGLRIPEDVAVLGVDNEITCQLSDPPLSSVKIALDKIGYEAAKLLDALMNGEAPANRQIMVAPIGVVARQSTDTATNKDWLVTEAMRFIRKAACRGCNVADVQKHLKIGRRTLSAHFKRALNRSPQAEIHRVQLAEIKDLLRETDFTLAHIATITGFEHSEYLSVFFKRETGLTPSEYRKHVLEFDDE